MGSLFRSDDSEIGPLSLFEKHILLDRYDLVTISELAFCKLAGRSQSNTQIAILAIQMPGKA